MAMKTSHLLTSVTGKGLEEPYLDIIGSELLEPLTLDQCGESFSTPRPPLWHLNNSTYIMQTSGPPTLWFPSME